MVKRERINYEELLEAQVPTLINFDKVEQYKSILKITPIDKDLLLGYVVNDAIYGDENFSFTLTLIIRLYKGYLFTKYDKFESLKYKFGDTCGYDIADNGAEAYVAVNSNGYEY
ncbi:MAG: hypothetical protein OSJ74_10545, partial [Clostridia bacterium]|nr:hypothetical protein [Clostridia bacterium]